MNYQESQWLIPLAPDRTLLCNCWEGFPRGREGGLLAIFAAKPEATWVCREVDAGLGSASSSFPLGRPAVMGISGGPCSFRLKRQTHPCAVFCWKSLTDLCHLSSCTIQSFLNWSPPGFRGSLDRCSVYIEWDSSFPLLLDYKC